MTDNDRFDLAVIGGGINGAGIARDAAGRGLKVLLAEAKDLGHATSAASSKLIHGGLRYLEYYEFRLVREALIEREVLLKAAPHIIWPLEFVLPHDAGQRPAWLIRLGLFLYDHLGGRKRLPGSAGIRLDRHPAGLPLQDRLTHGFTYADCWVEDSRLVVLTALDAAERGATVLTRTPATAARRVDGGWEVTLTAADGSARDVFARGLVNAGGPWVEQVLSGIVGSNRPARVRLIKGSHIVVRALFDHPHPYILQSPDGRVVFMIPYERDFTLIGTTDVPYDADPAEVAIDAEETSYLIDAANRFLKHPIGAGDIVWRYSGVRPLYDDKAASASAVTRDYVFDVEGNDGQPPLLSVFGGKITTYRKLAEHALDRLGPLMGGIGPAWTGSAALPGGDMPDADFDAYLAGLQARFPFLPAGLARRLARAYGTRAERILGDAGSLDGLGIDLGGGLTEAELDYLARTEWVEAAEDALWRRSKLGLHTGPDTAARVQDWLDRRG